MAWATTSKAATAVAGAVKAAPAGRSWGDRVRALPAMVRAVLFERNPSASKVGVTLSLGGLLYVLSPLDVLPEIIMGPFGLADDLSIAVVSVAYLVQATDRYLNNEIATASEYSTGDGDVIQGVVVDRSDAPPSASSHV